MSTAMSEIITQANKLIGSLKGHAFGADEPPKELFHYTSAGGLCGMLSSGEVWITHLRFMNDFSELRYGQKLVSEIWERELLKQKPEIREAFRKHPSAELIKPLELDPFWDVYVFSLSEVPNLLSQWRAYATGGAGYCVGFETAKIGGTFLKVEYNRKKQEELLTPMFEETFDFVERMSARFDARAVGPYALAAFSQSLLPVAARMKHEGFSEEREWRLVVLKKAPHPQLGTPSIQERIERAGQVEFRISKLGRILPFLKVRLADSILRKLPISVIWQGPHVLPELGKLSVELLRDRFGYFETKIEMSGIPLTEI